MWRLDQIHNIVTIVDYSHSHLTTVQRKRMLEEKTLMSYATRRNVILTTNLYSILNMIRLSLKDEMLGNRLLKSS